MDALPDRGQADPPGRVSRMLLDGVRYALLGPLVGFVVVLAYVLAATPDPHWLAAAPLALVPALGLSYMFGAVPAFCTGAVMSFMAELPTPARLGLAAPVGFAVTAAVLSVGIGTLGPIEWMEIAAMAAIGALASLVVTVLVGSLPRAHT